MHTIRFGPFLAVWFLLATYAAGTLRREPSLILNWLSEEINQAGLCHCPRGRVTRMSDWTRGGER